jgi:hypothetical protein
MESWKDRGWSWPSIVAGSAMVGISLGTMTYLADWGSRGSVIFAVVMGLGWLISFSIAKLVRGRAATEPTFALTISRSWFSVGLYVLLTANVVVVLLAVLAGNRALALTTAVLAVPLLVAAFLRGRSRAD